MTVRLAPLLVTLVGSGLVFDAGAEEPARPLIVAHRGLLRHAPENTLANFRACLELRLGFEFDVRRSKDGTLVCMHDETVDRTTDGTGATSELTLAEIARLDAGSWYDPAFAGEPVPTIEQVLNLVGEHRRLDVLVAVDLKVEGAEREVVQLARANGILHRLVFIGATISHSAVRERLKGASPEARTAAVANDAAEFDAALAANADWVYVRFVPTGEQIDAVHRAGTNCFIAGPTVAGDEPENWRRAADAGVDAILTDHPLRLRGVIRGDDGE